MKKDKQNKTSKKTLSVQLSPQIEGKIKALAAKEDRSMAAQIRVLLNKSLTLVK